MPGILWNGPLQKKQCWIRWTDLADLRQLLLAKSCYSVLVTEYIKGTKIYSMKPLWCHHYISIRYSPLPLAFQSSWVFYQELPFKSLCKCPFLSLPWVFAHIVWLTKRLEFPLVWKDVQNQCFLCAELKQNRFNSKWFPDFFKKKNKSQFLFFNISKNLNVIYVTFLLVMLQESFFKAISSFT